MTFDEADGFRQHIEGGYSNNPNDRGGETLYGISKVAHPEIDFDTLTPEGARLFFEEEYWLRYRCFMLHEPLDGCMYDAVVNHTPRKAVRLLQERIGVRQDGIIGPKTAAAAEGFPNVISFFLADRCDYYDWLNDQEGQAGFSTGWFRRIVLLSMFAADRAGHEWRTV